MLGEKIRSIRKSKDYTLNDLAKKVGLSVGYISQIERDLLKPTMDTLRKIADALDVSPYMLMDAKSPQNLLVKKEDRVIMKFPNSKIFYEIVSPMPSKEFSPASLVTQFEIESQGFDSETFLSHPSEETVVILSGEMDIITETGTHHLEEGDSVLIPKNCMHRSVNTGDKSVKGLCIMSPLKWPF